MLDCASKLDPDAEEFKPSGMFEAMEFLKTLVFKVVEATAPEFNHNFSKILQGCSSNILPLAPSYIGSYIVQAAVSKTGNASLAFRVIKRMSTDLDSNLNLLFQEGVFNAIHDLTLSRISGEHLQKLAETKSAGTIESGDVPSSDNDPVSIFEFLHLIMQCITDLNVNDVGEVGVPPSQPCVDLCILVDNAFRIQLELTENPKQTSESNGEPTTPSKRVPIINRWHCLLDVFLTKMIQSMPYFNLLLESSGEYIPPSTWTTLSVIYDKRFMSNNTTNNLNYTYSATLLSEMVDKILFRCKRLLVNDGFPSIWIRSVALDLLLNAVPLISPMPNSSNITDWVESSISSDADDVSIEGVSATDDQGVLNDFRSFLKTSGQVKSSMSTDT